MILAATALAGTAVPVAADIEQGTVSVSAEGSISGYPCASPCSPIYPAVTTGAVTGVDASDVPFSMSWGGAPAGTLLQPMATLQLDLQSACGAGDPTPTITALAGTIVSPGVLEYKSTLPMQVTVTANLYTVAVAGDPTTMPILSATFTASIGNTTVLSFIAGAAGVFNFVPLGTNFCPIPQNPMPFAVANTTATIL